MNLTSTETVRQMLHVIPADDREIWVRLGMAVKSELGDEGFAIWDEWSQSAENYEALAARDTWKSFRHHGVTLGSLIHEARQHGFSEDLSTISRAPKETEQRERVDREQREAASLRESEEAAAAQRAREIWDIRCQLFGTHPYLTGKGIQSHGLRLYRGTDEIAGMRLDGSLVVPVRNAAGEFQTLQFISAEGEKRFFPGGRKVGGYFAIGKPSEVICIAEGYATGASVHESTGHAVAVAFDAGNMLAVAKALRAKYPTARIIVCGDNDKSGAGQRAAEAAARSVGGKVALPAETDKDWNDIHSAQGSDAVRAAIEAAREPTMADTQATTLSAQPKSADPALGASDGWPDPQPLPSQLPPVQSFSFDLLPAALRGWLADIAERVQCPPEFVAVGAIVALGSIIGRKVGVRPKEKDDWTEFPNLWGAIIGKPGVLKSPALNEVLKPLRRLEANAMEVNQADITTWQAEKEAARVRRAAAMQKAKQAASKGKEFDAAGLVLNEDEREPQAQRYIVNDSSVEALGEVLRSSPNGVLAFRDELSGLLRSMDREGMEGARAFYLSAYSGKEPHVFDRIGRGLNLRVEHCCVSMLGSIQPDVISTYLREALAGGGGDGLLSRFSLLVWPDTSGEWRNVDRWPDTAHRQAANALFDRMDTIDPLTIGAQAPDDDAPFLRLGDSARSAFLEWRQDFELKQRTSEDHGALVAHFAKYRKLVPALAMIFHLSDSPSGGPVSQIAMLRALGWAELLETHARRAYASVQRARVESARALLVKIKSGTVASPFKLRDVYLKAWSGLSEPDEARRAAELLVELDYLRAETHQTGGRPATIYRVSPKVRP